MSIFGTKYHPVDAADAAHCKELEQALKGLKARMHSDPVRSSSISDAAGLIAVTMHMDDHDSLSAEIEAIELALHQACGFS